VKSLIFLFVFDFAEFIPYVFQVLALLLEMRADGSISAPYLALFPHLLQPSLWARDGNIPPLGRLLQAYIGKGILQVEADKLVCGWLKTTCFKYCIISCDSNHFKVLAVCVLFLSVCFSHR
jgi:hypothetical protein